MYITKFTNYALYSSAINRMYPVASPEEVSKALSICVTAAKEAGFLAREDAFMSNQGTNRPLAPALRVLRDYFLVMMDDQSAIGKLKSVGRNFSRIFSYCDDILQYSATAAKNIDKYNEKELALVLSLSVRIISLLTGFIHKMDHLYQLPVDPSSSEAKKLIDRTKGTSVCIDQVYGFGNKGAILEVCESLVILLRDFKLAVLQKDISLEPRSNYWKFSPRKLDHREYRVSRYSSFFNNQLVEESAVKQFIEAYLKHRTHYSII